MDKPARTNYTGFQGCSKAALIAQLFHAHGRLVIITSDRRRTEALLEDLRFFIGQKAVLLPSRDTLPFEQVSPQLHISASRINGLFTLGSDQNSVVVIPVDSAVHKTVPLQYLKELGFSLEAGQSFSRDLVTEKLQAAGFRKVSLAQETGDMAVRGAVIDFVPGKEAHPPLRVEFENGAIKAIKSFEPSSQLSASVLSDKVTVLPLSEAISPVSVDGEKTRHLRKQSYERLKARAYAVEAPPSEVASIIEQFLDGELSTGAENIAAIACAPLASPLSYINPETIVLLDDKAQVEERLENFWSLVTERYDRLIEEHQLIPEIKEQFLSPEEFTATLNALGPSHLDTAFIDDSDPDEPRPYEKKMRTGSNTELSVQIKGQTGSGAFALLRSFIDSNRNRGFRIAFVMGSKSRRERTANLLLEIGVEAKTLDITGLEWMQRADRHPVAILPGHISLGARLEDEKLIFISEQEIFGERSYRKGSTGKADIKKLLGSLSQLKQDDYVVHEEYGIGIYRGLSHREVEGVISDFLQIEYADSNLFLPIQHIARVQKFSAAEGQKARIDRLGSRRWQKVKAKVKEAIVALAGDLIKLYASRTTATGWRFEPQGAEDERFADYFPYQETQDQLKAIEETLADMADDKPMDRLVCGDVGFGKTEVALRAAFKCVQHGRQVAVLAPTTILVEQHKQSFINRFREYPAKIEAVSRFYGKEANIQTLQQVADGTVDIVIGTHRLIQHDVSFKDLGLLIIDEEHRFGVKQKERLKQLKKSVDVLSLTATPIPRTLHMSLLGIRDTSIISTPPTDRQTIRTYTTTFSETLVRDAIMRELQRGGQCFFVHNRVQSIESVASRLRELVPEARFEYAHGQMNEVKLEKIMLRFLNKEIDVLISTAIIESGLDIPNANTILIDRADMFGLAQLYQLRGRVGRSDRQAYAYFIVPPLKNLGAEARERLKVIQSLDDLGLGFNLAARDLEIRGAGNLLGKEQSGNVASVGFELYSRIIRDAVHHIKGEELDPTENLDPDLKLGFDAYIPDFYIPDISERLVLYQRLAGIQESEEADDLAYEIEDRFGNPPAEVINLIEFMRVRGLLRRMGCSKAEVNRRDGNEYRISLQFAAGAPVDVDRIMALIEKNKLKFRLRGNNQLLIMEKERSFDEPREFYDYFSKIFRTIVIQEE